MGGGSSLSGVCTWKSIRVRAGLPCWQQRTVSQNAAVVWFPFMYFDPFERSFASPGRISLDSFFGRIRVCLRESQNPLGPFAIRLGFYGCTALRESDHARNIS